MDKEDCPRNVEFNSEESESSSKKAEPATVGLPSKQAHNTMKDPWSVVVSKNKRKTIKGTNNQLDTSNTSSIKGVPKLIPLHVYRLLPNTKPDHVVNFLKNRFPEVKCEQLKSRHPEEYSSFKVDIYEDNFEAALDASIWPTNACVKRFLHFRPNLVVSK